MKRTAQAPERAKTRAKTAAKKKRKSKPLTPAKVQLRHFNPAIRRRDHRCVTRDERCSGRLEASHFFAVAGNGGIRFHPANAHTQCTHHHKYEYHHSNPLRYVRWMESNVPRKLAYLESVQYVSVRYTQDDLRVIASLCDSDQLDKVEQYVEALIDKFSKE